MSLEKYDQLRKELTGAFERGNVSEVIMLMDKHFESHNYSFWHLFRDDQKKILDQVLEQTMEGVENSFQQLYDNNYPLMLAMKTIGMKLPAPLQTTVEFIINSKLQREVKSFTPDSEEISRLLQEVKRMNAKLNQDALEFTIANKIDKMMKQINKQPDNLELMDQTIELLQVFEGSDLQPDFWQAQNIAFTMQQNEYSANLKRSQSGDKKAAAWCKKFESLYKKLNLKV
jgi:hypothetical protein